MRGTIRCKRSFRDPQDGKRKEKKKEDVCGLFYTETPVCVRSGIKRSEICQLMKNNIKHVTTTLRSGRSAHKRKPGNPPLSLRALFPADLYPLIKTNQGGILHVDSIALRRVESFDLDGWLPPSPPPVACSEGLANLIVLTPAWRGRGDLSLRAVSTTHSVPRTVFGLLVAS